MERETSQGRPTAGARSAGVQREKRRPDVGLELARAAMARRELRRLGLVSESAR